MDVQWSASMETSWHKGPRFVLVLLFALMVESQLGAEKLCQIGFETTGERAHFLLLAETTVEEAHLRPQEKKHILNFLLLVGDLISLTSPISF